MKMNILDLNFQKIHVKYRLVAYLETASLNTHRNQVGYMKQTERCYRHTDTKVNQRSQKNKL